MSDPSGILDSVKLAAKWHWNLLGVGAGTVLALLSPLPLGLLAIVGGLELAYLGFLGLNPRFQAVLRAQRKAADTVPEVASGVRLQQMLGFLAAADRNRFETLRRRCAELLDLRNTMDSKEVSAGREGFRGESLDQMLWLFLKLLHQKAGLDRFLATTERSSIEAELTRAEDQLKDALARSTDGVESRLATTIRERSETIRERLDNHRKAGDNRELVCAEIDKTEQQINQLCEVGMTLRDTSELSAQVSAVSASLQMSERVLADTSVGSLFLDQPAPPLLSGLAAGPPPISRRAAN
ncbi:MAG: hypothetical protein WCK77_18885 [Verrucomicrobiota bacterium]